MDDDKETDPTIEWVPTGTATPACHFLYSLAVNVKLDFADATQELIDNALDAKATVVTIFLKKGNFRITDNGIGTKDLTCFVRYGKSVSQGDGDKSGIWGVGVKEAVKAIGGFDNRTKTLCVARYMSVVDGIRRALKVDWTKQAASSTWDLPPTQEQKADGHERETYIDISGPNVREWKGGMDVLAERFGRIYETALRDGKRIVIQTPNKTIEVKPFEPPDLTNVIKGWVDCDGRKAYVRAGIIKKGQKNSGSQPLTYMHGYRAIMFTDAGCDFAGRHNIYGTVTLDNSWARAKNKNAIADDAEELYEAVRNLLSPLAPKVEELGIEMSYAAVTKSLDERLACLGGGRSVVASGHKNESAAARTTGNPGQKRGNNGKEGNGFADPNGASVAKLFSGKKRLRTSLAELTAETECDISQSGMCTLNIRYAHVKSAVDEYNKNKPATLLQMMAAALAADYANNGWAKTQLRLPDLDDAASFEVVKAKVYFSLSGGEP